MQFQFLNKITFWLTSWFLVWALIQTPVMVLLASRWPEMNFLFKTMSEIYLAVLVVFCMILTVGRPEIYQNCLVRLLLIYSAFVAVMTVILPGEMMTKIGGLLLNLRFIGLMAVMYVVGMFNQDKIRVIIRRFWWAGVVVIIFAVMQVILLPKDFLVNLGYSHETILPYLTIDQNPDLVRINSTLRGPNMLGAFCVIMMSWVAVKFVQNRPKVLIGLFIATTLALVASWSRSAWLAALITLLVVVNYQLKPQMRNYLLKVGLVLTVVMTIVGGYILTQFPNGWLSYYFDHVILHHNPEVESALKSNQEHSLSLKNALRDIAKQPLGHGVGATGSMTVYNQQIKIVENYFLAVGVEMGVFGMLLFSVVVGFILWQLYEGRQDYLGLILLASGVGLVVMSLVLPIWADNAVSYSWWGLVGLWFARKEVKNGTDEDF